MQVRTRPASWGPFNGGTPAFTVFDPTISGGTPQAVVCNPAATTDGSGGTPQPCLVLADGAPSFGGTGSDNDIPGDPPAADSAPEDTNPQGPLFSGYSDPCIRADSVVDPSSNPYGSNLYMTYSYALLNESSYMGSTYYSQAVEIHLAVSPTGMATSQPSGQSWCAGDATTCGAETVLFHSAEVSTSPPTFSSHEVSNIWEVPNYPPGGSTTTWFAVHLNYWIVPPMTIPNSIMNSGCLVVVRRQARRPTSRGPRNPASSRPPAATSRPTSA